MRNSACCVARVVRVINTTRCPRGPTLNDTTDRRHSWTFCSPWSSISSEKQRSNPPSSELRIPRFSYLRGDFCFFFFNVSVLFNGHGGFFFSKIFVLIFPFCLASLGFEDGVRRQQKEGRPEEGRCRRQERRKDRGCCRRLSIVQGRRCSERRREARRWSRFDADIRSDLYWRPLLPSAV